MREQKEQEKQNELLRVVAEQNHERLIEYDVKEDRAVVYAIENDRFEVLFDIEDYVKKNHYGSVFIDPEDKKVFRRAMHACLQKEGTVTVDVRYCEKENQPEWYRFYLVSIAEEDGKIDRMVGRFCCVQQEKAITERMRRRAEIDVLTNVYNHKAFEEYCAKELAECTTNALFVMLDIDDFKMINDTQGHAVGDMVLSQTGSILSEVTGDCGFVGRLGGDEFAVFVSGFENTVEMEEFCVTMRESLKKIIFDMEYSVSIGAAKLNGRRISFPDFYFEADRAVYAAKRGGKNRIVFYDQIKDQEEPQQEVPDALEPILPQGDENSMLRQLRTCMETLGKEGIGDAFMQTFESLRQYFDADGVVLAYAKDGAIRYVEECHRETAQMMARLVTEGVESGDAEAFIREMGKLGDVMFLNIKSLRESHPVIYEYLAEIRAWSAAGVSLYTGERLLGILMVLNPHRHLEESGVLSMLGATLVARIELRNLQEQQEYDRTHDKLTNLWNREGLSVMARTGEDNMFRSLGVITTDVIHLSEINKQFGYISGNRKLTEVADLLKSLFPNYRIYRYDEDEMLVLCINIERQEMEQQVENLQKKLEALGFGVAMGYSWSAHPNTKSQIAEAEVLMSNDKLKLMHGTTVMKRMEQSVIDEINDLMERGRYLVYLQPKVDIHTGRTEGAEALIRQLDDELGIVGPGMFIPVLEHYNLVHMIDLFVLDEVFRYQKEQIRVGHRTVPISVNFSKMTIMYPELIEKVTQMVQHYDIPVELIHIEVTETVGDMDHVLIENVANSLKELGFRLSMDDFGSHYSNLAVLIQYDFDSAKIDRSMVTEITNNRKSRILLDYMTSMINDLGIHCIVEGIETKEQVDILKKTKAEMIQGFYFGKPVPKEKFYEAFLAE